MRHYIIKFLSLIFFILYNGVINGQINFFEQDTTKSAPVIIDYSEVLEVLQPHSDTIIQKLKGTVELRQDSTYMYCDSATIINQVHLVAQGNVIIQQADTLNIFSDSLTYLADSLTSDLNYDVVLVNKKQKLFTQQLHFDFNSNIAQYNSNAMLTNDTTQLRSIKGLYQLDKNLAFFKDSVTIIDPNFELFADTLSFNTSTQIAYFHGPTIIVQNGNKIYCESGFYDIRNQEANFNTNAQFIKNDDLTTVQGDTIGYTGTNKIITISGNAKYNEQNKLAKANTIIYNQIDQIVQLLGNAKFKDSTQLVIGDSIVYNRKTNAFNTQGRTIISNPPQILEANHIDYDSNTQRGIAVGKVIWQDTAAQISIQCNHAQYFKENEKLIATGGINNKPLFIALIDDDSTFLVADTLLTFTDSITIHSDSLSQTHRKGIKHLRAFNDVRMYKSDLQALSDSLTYQDLDSTFHFLSSPIIWADTSQFVADTIHVKMKNKKINNIHLNQNALMINTPDQLFFNQIKGKNIYISFTQNQIHSMNVNGNAEAIYYAQDDKKAYIGVNYTASSSIYVQFKNKELDKITFYKKPAGNLQPMDKAKHSELQLKGFKWEFDRKPMSFEDLFLSK